MDEAEKEFKDKDDDVNAAARRCVLMEGEATVSVEKLATTVMKLALMSKEADNIIKGARHWESKNMNNEMEIETLETNLKFFFHLKFLFWFINQFLTFRKIDEKALF